ncbi:hypothetical protein EMIHUDRAFT_235153 [Emiliania huxleyi CCMP1516]|uniref:Uncharacterized protein n=2 Tax=Emiliania huxleyi TaxID=2903 RepID=A0A0D3JX51_EMIH1|nr:hypothetical protein EMIHUDRAFT_235153 [Emiliania huxleyi CCMP1516]EOD28086.1 hypothetical protein EMIHUDRAFT_235153 [Emiliania huxleyi CCMP1516]|eukprot:XP_005780515.1 hypothetical protein EMIHUDRAFT_235153 [Emiliania huxleyi CCMP1516]
MPLPSSPVPPALLSRIPISIVLRPANLEPAAEAVEVGRLILKAAEWSPQSHELFPEAARKRAVEVMRLGYLIAWDEERFDSREGAAPELADIWRGFVLPRVVAWLCVCQGRGPSNSGDCMALRVEGCVQDMSCFIESAVSCGIFRVIDPRDVTN